MDINNRFLETYNLLVDQGKISSKLDFANKLGLSSSLITDITKNRTKPGLTVLRNIVLHFPEINIEWLIAGKGEILKFKNYNTPTSNLQNDLINEPPEELTPLLKSEKLHPKTVEKLHPTLHPTSQKCEICQEKDRLLDALREVIEAQKLTIQAQQTALDLISPAAKKKAG